MFKLRKEELDKKTNHKIHLEDKIANKETKNILTTAESKINNYISCPTINKDSQKISKNNFTNEKTPTLTKPNINVKEKEYEYFHSGVYVKILLIQGYIKIEKKSAWSCCMNFQKDSKGCQRQRKEMFKWNFESM